MKIAVVGCGAVGSYYGAMLCRAGADVHFLLRSDYDVVRREGLLIRTPAGDFQVRPHAARSPEEIGVCELVLIGLKTTANDQFPNLLPPLVGPKTAVLTLQNGLGNEEGLAKLLRADQIMGGLCFVCLNRLAPGVILHLVHGLIVLGEFQRPPLPRTHEVATMFIRAGVPCKVAANLAQAHWEKLVWNIPFNGLGVAGAAGYEAMSGGGRQVSGVGECLTTDKLLNDQRWENLVREVMREVIAIGRALGYELADELADEQIRRTRAMGAYKASTLLDFESVQPLELDSMFLAPWREAQRMGVAAPRLTALVDVLRNLDQRRPLAKPIRQVKNRNSPRENSLRHYL